MNLFTPPIETLHWLLGVIALAFFLVAQLKLRQQLKNNPLYRLTTTLAIFAFLNLSFWTLPLIFTRDETLYTLFFVAGDLFSHAMFVTALLLLLHFRGWDNKSTKSLTVTAAFILMAGVEVFLLESQILNNGITIVNDRIFFELEGFGTLLYALMYIPFLLLGLFFITRVKSATEFSSKLRTLALGLILIPIALSFIATYGLAFFQNEPVSSEQDNATNIVIFSVFLTLNLAILVFTSNSVQSLLKKNS